MSRRTDRGDVSGKPAQIIQQTLDHYVFRGLFVAIKARELNGVHFSIFNLLGKVSNFEFSVLKRICHLDGRRLQRRLKIKGKKKVEADPLFWTNLS